LERRLMALYTVQRGQIEKRGVTRERFELMRDGAYVTGVDVPKAGTIDAWRGAAMSVIANLARRHDDSEPEFGVEDGAPIECVRFAEMLNA
jgi:hypothetical protein